MAHILHAHWQPKTAGTDYDQMFFWSESSAPTRLSLQREQSAPIHPFASAAPDTGTLIDQLTGQVTPFSPEPITLWLPTAASQPLPSPQMTREWKDEGGEIEPQFQQWHVPACAVSLPHALALLMALPAASEPPHTLKVGVTCRYWQTAARIVLETLAQQKVMPGMVAVDQDHVQARWLPVLDSSDDSVRLARLRVAMPGVCRAGANSVETAAHPEFLLHAFINQMTDAVFRQWAHVAQPAPEKDTMTDRWLHALFSQNATMRASLAQRQHFYTGYRAWTRNLRVAGDRHFRVALHLLAPEGRQRKWRLRFALQSREDPSLIIPAKAIWSGQIPPALAYPLRNAHELLLTGLGYAARFSTPLRNGLNRAAPDHITLSGPEAYTFLREVAPVLEASGFGILVPPWWNRPGARLGLKLRLKSATTSSGETVSKGLVSLENLVNYEWQLAIGDTVLSREEFNALVDLKSPLVKVRGQWVQLDAEQVEAAIQFWNKQNLSADIDLLDALALGLDTQAEVDGLPVDAVAFDGLLGQWVAQLQGDNALGEQALPAGLQATLRPYQRYGYAWLDFLRRLGIGGILADDMGLGKTIQALTLFQHIKEESGSLPAPILLICPTSVVTNWKKESARFTPGLRALVHQGPNRLRDADLLAACGEYDLILTSFALALRDGATLREVSWLAVVLDEAQHIKNPNAKRTRMIRSFSAQFRLSLTGTPVENRLTELWSIMQFLNPGYLGSRQQFRQTFAIPIERHNDEAAARRLRQLTQPFILRRMKTDPTVITDLPEKQEMKVYVHLSPEQATLYESVVQDTLHQVAATDGMQRRGMVLSLLMKLKQICNHPAQFLHQMGAGQIIADEAQRSGKLTRLVDLLETIIAEGDRALIFTQFTEMGGFLQRYLQEQLGLPALYLHGGTPAHKRDSLVSRFQTDPDATPVFLLSLKAGGTGLNLTRANHVFHFDRWWNPAVEDQATDRAFRIGQKRNVLVHKFVCVGTLEERIDEMIEEKKALADSIVGQGEHWLTELSTGDLRDLVKLRQEALT